MILAAHGGVSTIADGVASDWRSVGHLGDARAFERYQAAYYGDGSSVSDDPIAARTRATRAMDPACDKSSDLGGFNQLAVCGVDGFKYFPHAFAFGMAIVPGSNVLRRCTAAEGGFTLVLLVPREPGIGALATHFEQNGLGIFHYPRKTSQPIYYPSTDVKRLIEAVRNEYGVELEAAIEVS